MKILIVDDEKNQRDILSDILKDAGYVTVLAENGDQAVRKMRSENFPLILTDLKMPGKDGIEVLKQAKVISQDTQVIIMTAFGSIPGAVNAIKKGAYDYLAKPFKKDELLQVISRAKEKIDLLIENDRLKNEISNRYNFANLIGKSIPMQKIYKMIERISNTEATVLITGESGTGKELVARAIHFNGNRKNRPFIALNCGAIPENLIESELFGHEKGAFTGAANTYRGRFEQAQQGTIFLDEIGAMRQDLQIRLLRVLQEKKVDRLGSDSSINLDVRVIAATNEDLQKSIIKGSFRKDLFHRLNVFTIEIPPLRYRKEDIALLADHFLKKCAKQYNKSSVILTADALKKLENYNFPGNVRELENTIEKSVILLEGNTLKAEDLMLNSDNEKKMLVKNDGSLPDIELDLIDNALSQNKGSINAASQQLGITYKTLQYRMKKYKLNKKDYK